VRRQNVELLTVTVNGAEDLLIEGGELYEPGGFLASRLVVPAMTASGRDGGAGRVCRSSGFPSFADILLRCHEPPQWARTGLMHCSKACHYSMTSSARPSRVADDVADPNG